MTGERLELARAQLVERMAQDMRAALAELLAAHEYTEACGQFAAEETAWADLPPEVRQSWRTALPAEIDDFARYTQILLAAGWQPPIRAGDPAATVRPTTYTVSCLPADHDDGDLFSVYVEYAGRGRWAVRRMKRCYTHGAVWDWEPIPSERDEQWLDRYRFDLSTALDIARMVAPTLRVNGRTALDLLAQMEAARTAPAPPPGYCSMPGCPEHGTPEVIADV